MLCNVIISIFPLISVDSITSVDNLDIMYDFTLYVLRLLIEDKRLERKKFNLLRDKFKPCDLQYKFAAAIMKV